MKQLGKIQWFVVLCLWGSAINHAWGYRIKYNQHPPNLHIVTLISVSLGFLHVIPFFFLLTFICHLNVNKNALLNKGYWHYGTVIGIKPLYFTFSCLHWETRKELFLAILLSLSGWLPLNKMCASYFKYRIKSSLVLVFFFPSLHWRSQEWGREMCILQNRLLVPSHPKGWSLVWIFFYHCSLLQPVAAQPLGSSAKLCLSTCQNTGFQQQLDLRNCLATGNATEIWIASWLLHNELVK